MYFDSFQSLLAMDGHGSYVWAAYAITALVLTCLVVNPLLKKRRFFVQQRMQIRRANSKPA
jgi:heme exporter protein D